MRTGLLSLLLASLLAAGTAFAQTATPIRSVTTLPATCSPGGGSGGKAADHVDLWNGTTNVPYYCKAPNVWEPMLGGSGTQNQTAYFSAPNIQGGAGPGITGQILESQGSSSPPILASAGISGRTVSASTDTILCDSGTTVRDRETTVYDNTGSALTQTLPDAGSSGCGSNFTFAVVVGPATTVTFNRTTTSTFTIFNGGSVITGATSLTLTPGQYMVVNSPDNTNYNIRISPPGPASFSATSQVANISTTTLATPAAEGMFVLTATLDCRGSSSGATVTGTIGWTDPSSTTHTATVPTATCTTLGSASISNLITAFRVKAGTAVTYSTTIANTPTYDFSVGLVQMSQ